MIVDVKILEPQELGKTVDTDWQLDGVIVDVLMQELHGDGEIVDGLHVEHD
jgi:hypothetical protein